MGASEPSLNPYVKNGLLAMWDGEWNAGWGVHDSNATTWLELVNNIASDTLPSTLSFASDHLIKGTSNLYLINDASSLFSGVTAVTFEICNSLSVASANNNGAHFVYAEPLKLAFGGFRNTTSSGSFQGPMMYRDKNITNGVANGTAWNGVKTFSVASKAFVFTNLSASGARALEAYFNGTKLTGRYSAYTSTTTYNNYIRIASATSGQAEIYSIRIYGRALSASEIAANSAVDAQRFSIT